MTKTSNNHFAQCLDQSFHSGRLMHAVSLTRSCQNGLMRCVPRSEFLSARGSAQAAAM